MPRLIGRESEIARLRAAYDAVVRDATAHTLGVAGAAGIGKTALLSALEAFVTPAPAIVRANAFPFDRLVPFALLERLGGDLHERLDRATLEGPVVVIVRDVQFADDESLASLMAYRRALADRPLLLVLTQTDDSERELPIEIDTRFALGELDASDAASLVREHYPTVSQRVLDAIVAHARGIPYELVAIASAAARRGVNDPKLVDLSGRAAIAKELGIVATAQRANLQMLSLLSEPIEPALVELDVPDAFAQLDHPLTMAAIHETIAMKIPLRRRIIAALERRGVHTLREQLVFAEQVSASGDRALAQRVLLDLAFAAAAAHNRRAVVWSSERHLEIGEPPDDRFIAFYDNFFAALMEMRAFARAESVAAHALSEAQYRELRGLGALAARLIQAQWTVERPEAAQASYERYTRALDDPKDLELLREAYDSLRLTNTAMRRPS